MPNVQIKVVTIPPASSGFIPFARVIHSKLMTIDDEIAWVGTSNWTGGYLDNSRNLELVMHSAAMSGRLDQLYQQLWNSVYAEPLRLDYDYPTPAGRRILISRARLIPVPCVFTDASRPSPAPSPAARRSTLPPGGRCRSRYWLPATHSRSLPPPLPLLRRTAPKCSRCSPCAAAW